MKTALLFLILAGCAAPGEYIDPVSGAIVKPYPRALEAQSIKEEPLSFKQPDNLRRQ